MITQVPVAKLYKLCPVDSPQDVIQIGDGRMCGELNITFSQLLLNEMSKLLTDDDIVGYGGINTEMCLILVNFPLEHANNIYDGALISTDMIFRERPELMPEGGIIMGQVKNWNDIPDEQKAD